jgi:hypothetical protein
VSPGLGGDETFYDANLHAHFLYLYRQMASGGHLGFCFHQVPRDDERLVDNKSTGSWMPAELARFFQHVMNFRVESDRHDAIMKTPRTAFYSRRITSSEVPVEMNVEEEFERAGNNQEYNG